MFKYVAMIAGLIIMCVPEEAGMFRFILQGGFGLSIFLLGASASLNGSHA